MSDEEHDSVLQGYALVTPQYHEPEPVSECSETESGTRPLLQVRFRSPDKPADMKNLLNSVQAGAPDSRAASYRIAINASANSSPARGVNNPSYRPRHSPSTSSTGFTDNDSTQDTPAAIEMNEKTDALADKMEWRRTTAVSQMNLKSLRRRYPTSFMADGRSRIDYVLAFEQETLDRNPLLRERRDGYEKNLADVGLLLEHANSSDGVTTFVKIHAPFKVLCRQAEILHVRMPIKINDIEDESLSGVWHKLTDRFNVFKVSSAYGIDTPLYFTAPFSTARINQFLIADEASFFSNSQRSRLVYDLMVRTPYDPVNPEKVGCTRLISQGVYLAAFPLHEGSAKYNANASEEKPTDRQMLYTTWSRFSQFYKEQPLDLIRKYYGEKLGLYFAWLGYYTAALGPAALIGFLCVLFGASTYESDIVTREICDGSNITMCPVCPYDNCKFWNLSSTCTESQATYVFDNVFTVLFACVMSVWATVFLEGWTRYRYELAWKWDLLSSSNYAQESEVRPEFEQKVRGIKKTRKNPVTQLPEPFLPFFERCWRYGFSVGTVLFFLLLVTAFVFGIIVYRLIIMSELLQSNDPMYSKNASLITTASAACINLVVIILLGKVYQAMAFKLTEWEYPRTDNEFENSYTIKVFLFQFVNYYSSLFYIAFMRGKLTSVPGKTSNKLFAKYQWETCPPAGCMVELVIQLAIIMVGKQALTNIVEICFPILSNYGARLCGKKKGSANRPQWEKDYELAEVYRDCLFDEYLEMVIQYGFITLFVAAFPLAPLFALLNNLLEIRLDAFKFTVAMRRPQPTRAVDLGAWNMILSGIGRLAVLTNACVIAFTSEFVPKLLYYVVYGQNSMSGYMDWSLSYYDTEQLDVTALNVEQTPFCRFRDWRRSPCYLIDNVTVPAGHDDCDPARPSAYPVSINWWHVLAARLVFVLVFEHFVFGLKELFAYVIPDIPTHIIMKMQREQYLARTSNEQADKQEEQRNSLVQSQPAGSGSAEQNNVYNRLVHQSSDASEPEQQARSRLTVTEEDADADSVYYSPRQSRQSLANPPTRL